MLPENGVGNLGFFSRAPYPCSPPCLTNVLKRSKINIFWISNLNYNEHQFFYLTSFLLISWISDYTSLLYYNLLETKLLALSLKGTEAEFKEFEPRFKFETRLKYSWFHLKFYSMFLDLRRRSIKTGFWRIWDAAQIH